MIIFPKPGFNNPRSNIQMDAYGRALKENKKWEIALRAAMLDNDVELTCRPVIFINETLSLSNALYKRLKEAGVTGSLEGGYSMTHLEIFAYTIVYTSVARQVPLRILQSRKSVGGKIRDKAIKDQTVLSKETIEALKLSTLISDYYNDGLDLYLARGTTLHASKSRLKAAGLDDFFTDRTDRVLIVQPTVALV